MCRIHKLVQIVDATHLLNLEYIGEYREGNNKNCGNSLGNNMDVPDVPLGRWNRFHARDSSNTSCEVFLPAGYRCSIDNVPNEVRVDEGDEDGRKFEGVLDNAIVRLEEWSVSSVPLVTGKGCSRLTNTHIEYMKKVDSTKGFVRYRRGLETLCLVAKRVTIVKVVPADTSSRAPKDASKHNPLAKFDEVNELKTVKHALVNLADDDSKRHKVLVSTRTSIDQRSINFEWPIDRIKDEYVMLIDNSSLWSRQQGWEGFRPLQSFWTLIHISRTRPQSALGVEWLI